MKKQFAAAMLGLVSLVSLNGEAAPFARTELSIRPLKAGLAVESGVLGSEVRMQIDGRQMTEKAIYLTGQAAHKAVVEANGALRAAGETVRYGIDTTKQMLVITGPVAINLIEKFGTKGAEAVLTAGRVASDIPKATLIETKELAAVSVAYAKLGLVDSVTFAREGLSRSTALIKVIERETVETTQDTAMVVYKNLRIATDFSKQQVMAGLQGTAILAKASLLYVNDAGVFVFDQSRAAILQVGQWGKQGLSLAKSGLELTAQTANFIQRKTVLGLKSLYQALPQVSVDIRF